jgi:hypothetical protein
LLTVNDIANTIENKSQKDMILLDFSKAFDKVPHELLLRKLKHYGINTSTLNWITSFLSDRTQEVVVEGSMSKPSPVTSGVPQGSVLGPMMFLLYINDLPNYINNGSSIRLFADDAIIYRDIDSIGEAELLQQDLNCLLKWEKDWGMSFHPDKCIVLRTTFKRSVHAYTYHIREQMLKVVESAKYLGVTLNSRMSWAQHISSVTAKAGQTLSLLQRNINHVLQISKC